MSSGRLVFLLLQKVKKAMLFLESKEPGSEEDPSLSSRRHSKAHLGSAIRMQSWYTFEPNDLEILLCCGRVEAGNLGVPTIVKLGHASLLYKVISELDISTWLSSLSYQCTHQR